MRMVLLTKKLSKKCIYPESADVSSALQGLPASKIIRVQRVTTWERGRLVRTQASSPAKRGWSQANQI